MCQRIQFDTHKETCNLSRQKGSELKPLKQTMKEVINFYETGCSSFHDDVVTLTYRIRISFSPFQTESMTLSMSLRLMYKSNKSATWTWGDVKQLFCHDQNYNLQVHYLSEWFSLVATFKSFDSKPLQYSLSKMCKNHRSIDYYFQEIRCDLLAFRKRLFNLRSLACNATRLSW